MSKSKFKITKGSTVWRVSAATFALLFGVTGVATSLTGQYATQVHSAMGTSATKFVTEDNGKNTQYYKSSYDSWQKQYQNAEELIKNIQEEGSVLLTNNGTLPLKSGAKVSLFSRSSTDIVYSGTGSGSIDTAKLKSLREAMEESGFEVNPVLWDFYKNQEGYKRTEADIAEVPVEEYTQDVLQSLDDYNDVAIVTISRTGGEGTDLDYNNQYLELQEDEKKMLELVNEHFDKIVVLVNSNNAVSLNWLDEYNVDACIWIGGPGQTGLEAVAEELAGIRTPSGKLTDTYASSSLSSPAMQNFGNYKYANCVDEVLGMGTYNGTFTDSNGEQTTIGNSPYYVVYAEGIYVGYRYYETRYEDTVLKQGNADGSAGVFNSSNNSWNYAEEVDFSFGYGLSYAQFEQTLDSVEVADDMITVTATVTNTGSQYSGKDVVEVYAQTPYVTGGVEKTSVQLCGFVKTGMLAPGESETVQITIDKTDLASYDSENEKTYVLDEGIYYFSIGNGAHEALNNILAAKGYTSESGMDEDGNAEKAYAVSFERKICNVDSNSGNEVGNLFDTADLNYYQDNTVTYLSRADWQNTWPKSYDAIEATNDMIHDLQNNYEPVDTDVTEITYGADNGLNIADMIGLDYDDEKWDLLLDEMTQEEQMKMVTEGAYGTASVESIAFGGSFDSDGPAGIAGMMARNYYEVPGDDSTVTTTTGIGYNSATVIASTWNTELMFDRGESIGEDGLWTSTSGWYGPAANTHRTPYAGRNFEYYSEDSYLGSVACANEVAGAQSKGMRVYLKHFVLNDQETNRHGIATYANEQSIREIYLKQFKEAVQQSDVTSVMGAYIRIGTTWCGANTSLLKELLEKEWGSHASVITDAAMLENENWMNPRSGLAGGTNQWLGMGSIDISGYMKDDIRVAEEIRESCHKILYAAVRSSAINGINETTVVVKVTAWWQKLLYTMDIVFGIVAAASVVIILWDNVDIALKKEKENETL